MSIYSTNILSVGPRSGYKKSKRASPLIDVVILVLFRDVLKVNEEGAIVVDENMQTSVKGNKCFIYLFVLSCSSQEFSG